jgi:hypothetical protein
VLSADQLLSVRRVRRAALGVLRLPAPFELSPVASRATRAASPSASPAP